MFKNLRKAIKATALCVRYPFLYPRNRWNGLHYTNHVITKKISELYKESHESGMDNDDHFYTRITNRWKYILWRLLSFYHDHVLQWTHCLTDYTEWESIPDGWRNAFGDQMLNDLRKAMIKDGGYRYLHKVRILQVKEKFGTLRIYLDTYGKEIEEVIERYEELSWHTCIRCGKPAVGYTTSWICPYCKDCKKSMDRKGHRGEWFKYFNGQTDKNENYEE